MGETLYNIESCISKLVLFQHIICPPVSDTGPIVLWFKITCPLLQDKIETAVVSNGVRLSGEKVRNISNFFQTCFAQENEIRPNKNFACSGFPDPT